VSNSLLKASILLRGGCDEQFFNASVTFGRKPYPQLSVAQFDLF